MRKTKEIRRLLMGQVTVRDGYMQVGKLRENLMFQPGNGCFSAMILGVMRAKRYYQIPAGRSGQRDARNALNQMGQPVKLLDSPDVQAVFRRNTISDQCILTAEVRDGDRLELSAFQGRSLLGRISMFFLLRQLASRLPDGYEKAEADRDSKKKERKEKKAEKRQSKKSRKKKNGSAAVGKALLRQNLSILRPQEQASQPEAEQDESRSTTKEQ